jgi:Mlc titration factor MtfA (ptsG expression regulator)
MANVKVSSKCDRFTVDGVETFLLGDTAHTALYNPTIEEWKEYLDYRKRQDFNLISMNVLHQWDGGDSDLGLYPFSRDSSGRFKWNEINERYYEHIQEVLELARTNGFIPKLCLLHASYVPGTWATKQRPEGIMPEHVLEKYLTVALAAVKRF